jgi:antitoxin CcdA
MARELDMNVSRTVDALLAQEVKRQYWARWQTQNLDAIASYNARIEQEGLPLDAYRSF